MKHTDIALTVVLFPAVFFSSGFEQQLLAQADSDSSRRRMVEEAVIEAGITNSRVIDAMLAVPRHEFLPPGRRKNAYKDMAIPIGQRQTISSPYIVALMTQKIDPQPTDRVLEIRDGGGGAEH